MAASDKPSYAPAWITGYIRAKLLRDSESSNGVASDRVTLTTAEIQPRC